MTHPRRGRRIFFLDMHAGKRRRTHALGCSRNIFRDAYLPVALSQRRLPVNGLLVYYCSHGITLYYFLDSGSSSGRPLLRDSDCIMHNTRYHHHRLAYLCRHISVMRRKRGSFPSIHVTCDKERQAADSLSIQLSTRGRRPVVGTDSCIVVTASVFPWMGRID